MDITKRKIKKWHNINHYPMCYAPLKERTTTYYVHKKGIVGIDFINHGDCNGNKIILEFIKDEYIYTTRIKEFKSERSLALLISKFHKLIEATS